MPARIYADVIGSRQLAQPETLPPALDEAVVRLNELFAPAIAAPFLVVDDDAAARRPRPTPSRRRCA